MAHQLKECGIVTTVIQVYGMGSTLAQEFPYASGMAKKKKKSGYKPRY